MEKKYDLEKRLVRFVRETIKFCNSLQDTFAEVHLRN